MRERVKSGVRTKKARGWRGEGEKLSLLHLSPSRFFVLAPLFARSLISRRSIPDDLLEEKRKLLTVYCGAICVVLYCIVLYRIILYCTILLYYTITPYCVKLCCIVLSCTVLYCTVQCCIEYQKSVCRWNENR